MVNIIVAALLGGFFSACVTIWVTGKRDKNATTLAIIKEYNSELSKFSIAESLFKKESLTSAEENIIISLGNWFEIVTFLYNENEINREWIDATLHKIIIDFRNNINTQLLDRQKAGWPNFISFPQKKRWILNFF